MRTPRPTPAHVRRWKRRQVARELRALAAGVEVQADAPPGSHARRMLSAVERRDLRRIVARLRVLASRLEAEELPDPEPDPPPTQEEIDLTAAWAYLRSRRR